MKYAMILSAGLFFYLICNAVAEDKKYRCLKETSDISEQKALWSPDGNLIAVVSEAEGMETVVYNSENRKEILKLNNVRNIAWHP